MMTKKGNVAIEITVVMVVIISLIIAFPIIYSHLSPFMTSFADSSTITSQAAGTLDNFNSRLPRMLDNIFLITLILFWAGGIILALFIDTHPVFFVISLLLVVVVLWCGVFLGDFAEDFMNTDAVELSRDNMPITYFVSQHILEFMIAITFSMLLALFGKTSRGGF